MESKDSPMPIKTKKIMESKDSPMPIKTKKIMESKDSPMPIKVPEKPTLVEKSQISLTTGATLGVLFVVAIVGFLIYRFYVSAYFGGNLDVNDGVLFVDALSDFVGINTKTPAQALDINGSLNVSGGVISDTVTIASNLQVPIDTSATVTEGSLQFSTNTNSLQVYKDSDGWVEVGGGAVPDPISIPIAETLPGLVEGVDNPLNVTTFQASFNGGTIAVNDEATFNAATAAAAENARIQLTANITCAGVLTIPNKALWIDLNGFTLSVPVQITNSIVCQQSGKNIYFSGGTVQYTNAGTTGSSSALISASNCFLTIRNVTLLHAEYAVSITGNSGNRLTFYTSGSTYTMVKARSTNNNTYGPIGLFGMVTDDSYVYVRQCTFDTLFGDTYLTATTDLYNMRGVVRCANGTHSAGSCTITGCTINPAHRIQAVFYSDIFPDTGTRGSFRLRIDTNTIGDAGVREQLIILVGSKPLNYFDSIYILENTFERMDSNKGIMYVETTGGSTDVYIFNNTIPPMKSVAAITFSATYTRTGNVATITTPIPHNFTVGYNYTVAPGASTGGLSSGPYIVQSILSPTEFTTFDSVSGSTSGTTLFTDTYASSLRKLVSKDGLVRGPFFINGIYLQKYNI
jgi:hypothetical protein